jgi:hypothetical protein
MDETFKENMKEQIDKLADDIKETKARIGKDTTLIGRLRNERNTLLSLISERGLKKPKKKKADVLPGKQE